MRVVVCGSRDFDDRDTLYDVLLGLTGCYDWDSYEPQQGTVIIEGVCPHGGADKLAAEWAKMNSLAHEPFPPAVREGFGRPTSYEYLARNRAMIDSGADLCIAFVNKPLATSRGTAYTVDYARKQGVRTIVVEVS